MTMIIKALLLLLAIVAVSAELADDYTFADYVAHFNKQYNGEEYNTRKAIFDTKVAKIRAHNKDTSKTWKEDVNHLTDYTDVEFKALRGYKKGAKLSNPTFGSVHETPKHHIKALPKSVDWRKKNVVTPVKNQANCGSCWSFGTAETLESAWAIKHGNLVVLSEQQILDCTPNPKHCGGTGGCGGGTVEVVYEYIMGVGGLASEADYAYVSGDGHNEQCKSSLPTPVAKVANYTVLPSNQYAPLLHAIATVGPIAISVDAGTWSGYSSGVFNGCDQKNPDIDHAVQLVGYGTDAKLGDYWLVRNSWGPDWGEKGYIRLKRTSTVQCGVDTHPSDGDGCDGGPATVTVCGTCGILFDTVYPTVV